MRCGCIHGLCYVRGVMDATVARESPWYDAAYTRADEITAYVSFEQPVAARGNLGAWPISGHVDVAAVRTQIEAAAGRAAPTASPEVTLTGGGGAVTRDGTRPSTTWAPLRRVRLAIAHQMRRQHVWRTHASARPSGARC